MIRLTEQQAELVRGEYKPNHTCEPIKIEDGFYMLHDKIKEVKELLKKFDFNKAKKFKQEDTDIYNQYVIDKELELGNG